MNFRKILCVALALVLALGTLALAESDDLQAQLDAANARIAELEAEVAKYLPVYESQIVAEYGDGNVIMLKDAREQYDMISQMYAQYGLSLDSYADDIKGDILSSMVKNDVTNAKITELGIDQLDEQTVADLTEKAQEDWEGYVTYAMTYMTGADGTEEEKRAAAIERLTSAGYSLEALLEERKVTYAEEQLVEYVTKDVTVTDDEIQEAYLEKIAANKEDYGADDYNYNAARTSGETIAWNPAGYRAVKHVLIRFDDDQSARYKELQSTLSTLKDELEALDEAEDETKEPVEEEVEARTAEEIQADMGQVGAEIEELYSELLPKAQEVIDAFNGGAAFDDLIAQYGEDPGMTSEPSATIGYAVAEDSSYWEQAFIDGAMAIAEVGQISEPVRGSNGIHIIYYMSDIEPGDVEFDTIKDSIRDDAMETKKTETYEEQTAAWVEEAHPVYHMDRFI